MTGMPPKKDPLKGQKTLKVSNFLEEFEVDDIKRKVDIVELFESFGVKLSGKDGNFIGLCPFHEDHKPSLSVDRDQGLFNCFSGKCRAKGSVVDAVKNFKNMDFKEALAYLKSWKKPAAVGDIMPALSVKQKIEPAEPAVNSYELAASLNTVAEHYHKKLYENPAALEYLKKRGLTLPELYEKFRIGFADGSLLLKIGENQKRAFIEAGILNEAGHEHFYNCVIFPISEETGNTLSLYGRNIESIKHLYLKGPHCGIFNRRASKIYNEIILAESIIDALSLAQTGLENIQSIFGTNGFTDEHLEILKTDRVKTVVLALDADEAGRLASDKLKDKLINEGFKVKIVSPWLSKYKGLE